MTAARCIAAFGLITLAASASAQINMKPGLWEIKQTMQADPERQAQMEKAQKAMESMPAAQKQMMQDMMAKRGVSMDFAGGAVNVKVCVTEEQTKRDLTPSNPTGNCTHDVKRSGNVIHTHFVCTDPASEGEGTTTLHGNTSFTSDVKLTRQRAGKTATTSMSGEGHWVSSDCGDIKPIQARTKP